ncbi:conserved Plasmodium protein, unknown function [Plasmodium ovale wallikeri]|uniref:Uncharacterized protein n=1 Tax=Plasmodium ovale wallikeri TaxID=864142 RepID=A0A1A8ZJZ4_PLAOA|nr:conserved Plasmodium protein, unknown function [Plasmodium ovale wallikeri]
MSHHASEKESNEETFVEEKKKKKKKKKKKIHPYTVINEVNCSQDEGDTSQSPVECNTNSRSGPKNDFLREEANNPVASSERCIEEVKLCDYLDALNGGKREGKKVKKKKNRGKNDNDNDDMGIHGRDDGRNGGRNDSHYDKQHDIAHNGNREVRCSRGSCNKVDLELVAIPHDSLSKARIGSCPNGYIPNVRKSDGNNEPLNGYPNVPPNVPPNESSNEDLPTGVRHNDDSVDQSNVFSKLLYRIKKVIKNRKGDPLTNENTEGDSDMCELTVMESGSSALPHVIGCVAGTSNNTGNCSQFPRPSEVFENGPGGDIIYLTGVNPNDVLDSSILSNRELGIGSGVHSGGSDVHGEERDVHGGERVMHGGERGVHRGGRGEGSDIRGRGNDMYEGSPFVNRVSRHMGTVRLHSISNGFAQCKDYATYLRDKIKKYWLERVHEANIQLSTPHQNTSRRENTTPNEEEGDDPSCLQVLFFLGLICKFPVLWIIGSILFCVTPNEHKRTKAWCLINTVFAIISIIYFFSTSNFKITRPTFSVLMGQIGESYEQQTDQQTEQTDATFQRGTLRSEDNVSHNLVHWTRRIPKLEISDHAQARLECASVRVKLATELLRRGNEAGTKRERSGNEAGTKRQRRGNDAETTRKRRGNMHCVHSTHSYFPPIPLRRSSGSYMLLNRVQVTIFFGKGSRYPQEHVNVIRTFFQGVKNDMEAVPFEKLTMTDEE